MNVSDLDETLCAPSRLAIMLTLADATSPLSFMELRKETGLADGNLHVQTRKLAEVGFIDIRKSGTGRGSLTVFLITDHGHYSLKRMQQILDSKQAGRLKLERQKQTDGSQVW